MTQETNRPYRTGRWALAGAALLFAAVLGGKWWSGHRAVPEDAAASTAISASESPPQLAAIEATARDHPRDGAALRALGQGYFDVGRFSESVSAYERATAADPGIAAGWSALGEARVMASPKEPLPPPALAAFRKALALDPRDPRARYFVAVRQDLDGDHQGAIAAWLALLAETPPGAPWEDDLKRTILQVGKINRIEVSARIAAAERAPSRPAPAAHPALAGIPGPSADDLAAAGSIPPSQQAAMAASMVARLDARLKANPADPDGWAMLVRSRHQLGEDAKARAALAAGIAANPAAADSLREQAAAIGVR